MKYHEWLTEWLKLTKPDVKQCTYERYASYVRIQIAPELGEYDLDRLTALHIRDFITALSERGYAAGTVNCVASVVKRSLVCAELLGIRHAELNCKMRYRLRYRSDIKCLSLDGQRRLEKYVKCSSDPKLYGITLCLYTGLRVGELMALKWSDIDFKTCLLHVNGTCHDLYTDNGYQKRLDSPKTFKSKRTIPLPKQLIPNLKQLKAASKSEFVISGKDGKLISKRSYQSTFGSVLKRVGLPHMGIHSLRHTFATRALESGMDVKTLSEILGHKNAAITLNCYVHSMLEHKQYMMDKIGRMLQ